MAFQHVTWGAGPRGQGPLHWGFLRSGHVCATTSVAATDRFADLNSKVASWYSTGGQQNSRQTKEWGRMGFYNFVKLVDWGFLLTCSISGSTLNSVQKSYLHHSPPISWLQWLQSLPGGSSTFTLPCQRWSAWADRIWFPSLATRMAEAG